jgi:hypothetical protein
MVRIVPGLGLLKNDAIFSPVTKPNKGTFYGHQLQAYSGKQNKQLAFLCFD